MEHARLAREELLAAADRDCALEISNELVNHVNDRLNALGVPPATSLLARALISRAVLEVAGLWWADMVRAPAPVTIAALRSIVDDPPPWIATHTFNIETGQEI